MKGVILIVDDVPENIQVLGKILSSEGYDLAIAENGKIALEMVKKTNPDIILMDIMMPEMDGITACKKLKGNSAYHNIPVLFISAKSKTEDKLQGFEAGGADYISKPFDSTEVLARVKTHIRLKKAMDEIKQYNTNLEALLEKRTKDLIKAERNAAFSLFSKGIIHNLKNPISIISGGVQVLDLKYHRLNGNNDPEALKAFVKLVMNYNQKFKTANDLLLSMVNNLMDRVRNDSEENLLLVNLNQIVENEIRFYNADLQFKHYTKKEIYISSHEMYVRVVPGEFNQILQNLVRNALDAMYQQKDARITIKTFEKEGFACCSVSDNGPGIPLETQDKIFDPFYTTKPKASENTEGPKGTGLGLYMVKTIMEKYNGRIELESMPGKGTCFTIYLPLEKN